MFALVVVEKRNRSTGKTVADAFFCPTASCETFHDFLGTVAERLNIVQRVRVIANCKGFGELSAETKMSAIHESLDGKQLRVALKFVRPTSNRGILYYPSVNSVNQNDSFKSLAKGKTILSCH